MSGNRERGGFKGLAKKLIPFGIGAAAALATTFISPEVAKGERLYRETKNISVCTSNNICKDSPLEIEVDLDKKGERLEITYITENYAKTNWGPKKERLIPSEKYTEIKDLTTKIYIIHPPEIEIIKSFQRAYVMPDRKFLELIPFEENTIVQKEIKWGKKVLDSLTKWLGGPSNITEKLEKSGNRIAEPSRERLIKNLQKIHPGYTITPVPNHTLKVEDASNPKDYQLKIKTAKQIAIPLNMYSAPEKDIPLHLWMRVGLGDINKDGISEPIQIDFSLSGRGLDEIKSSPLESSKYFFNENELGNLRVLKKGGIGRDSRQREIQKCENRGIKILNVKDRFYQTYLQKIHQVIMDMESSNWTKDLDMEVCAENVAIPSRDIIRRLQWKDFFKVDKTTKNKKKYTYIGILEEENHFYDRTHLKNLEEYLKKHSEIEHGVKKIELNEWDIYTTQDYIKYLESVNSESKP